MHPDEQHAVRRRGLDVPYPQDPLRALGGLAQAVVALVMAACIWEIVKVLGQRSIIDRIMSGDRTVTEAEIDAADSAANTASNLVTATAIVAAIGFASWFWRVRRVSGEYDPRGQRRSQGWAFWGWVVPIVNFWFPYQIASDALGSTPRTSPRAAAVLRAWWAFWLLAVVTNRVLARQHPQTIDDFRTQANWEIVGVVVQLVAGVLAIATVAMITRALDQYGDELRRDRAYG